MRELAFLNKGIKLTLTDERQELEDSTFRNEVFHSQGGLKEFVTFIDGTREKLIPEPIYCESDKHGIPIEIAFQYISGCGLEFFTSSLEIIKSINSIIPNFERTVSTVFLIELEHTATL